MLKKTEKETEWTRWDLLRRFAPIDMTYARCENQNDANESEPTDLGSPPGCVGLGLNRVPGCVRSEGI